LSQEILKSSHSLRDIMLRLLRSDPKDHPRTIKNAPIKACSNDVKDTLDPPNFSLLQKMNL